MSLYDLIVQNQTEIFTVASIAIMMAMSPGADFALVTKNSLSDSRKAGIYTTFGITIGVWVHISYCIAGLAVLIYTTPQIYSSIKLLGALYLIYIGIKSFLSKQNTNNEEYTPIKMKPIAAITGGFLSNALNPKTTLFFLGIFTQLVNKETPLSLQFIYGSIISLAHLAWFATLSYLLTNKHLLPKTKKYQNAINKLLGVVLIALGIKLIFL